MSRENITGRVVQIMNEMAGKSMDVVSRAISKSCSIPLPRARAYYRAAVRNGTAPGIVTRSKATIGRERSKDPIFFEDDDSPPSSLSYEDLRFLF